MKIKASKIKPDTEIKALRPINDVVVSRYRQAMRNGDVFPPLVVDASNRLISGYHRLAAATLEFGEHSEIEIVREKFADKAGRIERAIEDNAKHGHALDGVTRKRAAIRLAELGREPGAIARLLGVSVKRVEELAGMHVVVTGGKGSKPERKAIKHGLEHMAGTVMKADQYESHAAADRGVPVLQSARQLTRWIKNGWINEENANEMAALESLAEALKTLNLGE